MENHSTNQTSDVIVGIDLGTTNSLIAVYLNDQIKVIAVDGDPLLPSYVGLSPSNELLIGHPARNQYIVAPERTIKSIKRRMGGTERVQLGDRSLLPEEVSAIILKHLKDSAEKELGMPIHRAVITVPAFFNDTQRQATRIAGEIAGLEVVRIINEPTAASLAFRYSIVSDEKEVREISAVYDLGGGTFDVSIVREEGEVVEVLSSRGDTRLGGDDFDRLILDHFLSHIQMEYNVDLRENRRALNRLHHAAEAAKIELSSNIFVNVIEEDLAEIGGKKIHLELELTRGQYDEMILSLIHRTINCIQQALHDANLTPTQVDNVLLAGGSTRTPIVRSELENYFHAEPRTEIHPDLCVVMGAALLAARIQGQDVKHILVDITPYTFGIRSVATNEFGMPNFNYFSRIIHRNTPLPVTQSEEFSTMVDYQEKVEVDVFQGESDDVRDNLKIGSFIVEGLSKLPAGNIVIGRMSLDLNSILTVTAIEKKTGLQKHIKIEGAFKARSPEEISAARKKLFDMLPKEETDEDMEDYADIQETEIIETSSAGLTQEHKEVLDRARKALEKMHIDDRLEAEDLIAQIESNAQQGVEYDDQLEQLQDLLYFVGA